MFNQAKSIFLELKHLWLNTPSPTILGILGKNKDINMGISISCSNTTNKTHTMTVIIPKEVYFTVVAACVRFANRKRPKADWKEVSGIFTGNIQKNERD